MATSLLKGKVLGTAPAVSLLKGKALVSSPKSTVPAYVLEGVVIAAFNSILNVDAGIPQGDSRIVGYLDDDTKVSVSIVDGGFSMRVKAKMESTARHMVDTDISRLLSRIYEPQV